MKTFGEKRADKSYIKREGAYALCVKAGKIAVIQFYQGCFLPGGGVDDGETSEGALKRELREELGWEIEDIKEVCVATQFFYTAFKDMYIENIGHFFTVGKIKEGGTITEENHELVWLTPKKAIEKLYHEHQRWAVKTLFGL